MTNSIIGPLLALSRVSKRIISIVIDMALCTLSVWIAYYLRLGAFLSLDGRPSLAVVVSICLAIPIFVVSGLYRAVLRHAGQEVVWVTIRACAGYGVIYASIFAIYGFDGIPRTVGIIQPLLLFALIVLSRTSASYWLGGAYRKLVNTPPSDRTMIYGAGMSGRQLAAAIADGETMKVVGFLDDDRTLQGRMVNGLPVYDPKMLNALLTKQDLHHVLLAIPSLARARRNEIISQLREANIEVRILPGVVDLAQGEIKVDELRPLSIDDLLSRAPVPPASNQLPAKITGRTVMITGAGGSIGSELTRQVMALRPQRLLLIESSEYALYAVHRELESLNAADCELIPLLASITDEARMRQIMRTWQPNQIYHAAAYKHVPLVEHNILEGVRNNALGTLIVARLAIEYKAENFVLISTDKAVRPTNTMGASKRLAELILQGLASTRPSTCLSMVRFGNVLGSSGSVVPLFREQIRNGGPVTLTHTDMTRYFMTIPEAAQLVMQAGAMAKGGEVFVLDMGEPVRIFDLARNMIELSGLTVRDTDHPNGDIEIRTVGLRPGEKLYEELLIGDNPQKTLHPRIMMANEKLLPWDQLQQSLEFAARHILAQDTAALRQLVLELVEEFTPTDDLLDWTHLATAQPRGK